MRRTLLFCLLALMGLSLFAQQLEDRTNAKNAEKCRIYMRNTNASSNPAVEDALILAEEARTVPRVTLEAWIDSAVFNSDLLAQGKAKVISAPAKKSEATHHNIAIANGQITKDGSAIAGNLYSTPWWRGNIRPSHRSRRKVPFSESDIRCSYILLRE